MARPGEFQVGQLYLGEYRNGIKVWNQPIPGGLVYPQLPSKFPDPPMGYPTVVMSYPALYYLGCGHPQNCLEIYQYGDPYTGQLLKLICCGLCSYISQILTADEYNSYIDTPIVIT